MPNTSVHFPPSLLASLDRIAAEQGVSRNRVIVESCRRTAAETTTWPQGFFSNDHLTAAELEALQEAGDDFDEAMRATRRSRTRPLF